MEMWSYNRLILQTGQSSLQVDVYSKIVLSDKQGMVFYKVLVGSLRGLGQYILPGSECLVGQSVE